MASASLLSLCFMFVLAMACFTRVIHASEAPEFEAPHEKVTPSNVERHSQSSPEYKEDTVTDPIPTERVEADIDYTLIHTHPCPPDHPCPPPSPNRKLLCHQ
ncbi:hypothetical protein RJT34_12596 [Clitoria ternatea]|uniref:Uncharacterized protein n=1 Tax=Clitoria ternatea TaxID=43366 RepID=A0AAN9JP45_CLITE